MVLETRRLGAAAVAAALLAAVATTAAVAANGGASTPKAAKPKAISPAAAFVLPSATACVRARKLTVRVRALRQVAWHEAIVSIDGRRFRTVTRSRITRPVRLTGLPVGRFVLSITATASDERSTTASRTYRTCAPPPPPPSHSLLVTVAGSGSGSVSGSGIGCPGSCSHSYPAGTTVTLSATPASGSSFGGWSGAGCGGTGTCAVTLSSDRSLTATFTLARGTVTGPPPAVSGVSPSSGPLAGGSSATITGTNLTGATAVKFGSTAAGFTVDSATRITATAPAGSGTVDVTVTTRGGTSATSAADRYTYLLAPTVSGVSPSSGPLAGGTSVTITGTSFVAGATVAFGADPATNVTVDSATRITATAPAGSGTVDVTVSTPGGTSAVSTADRYTYLAGATLKVNTTTDGTTAGDHLCSLREAIAAANAPGTASDCGTAGSVANTIVLGAGTYTLSIAPTGADDNASGDLNVTGATPLTIVGVGASKTVIDAAGLGDRVLSVGAGATVTLQDLEISGGQAPAGAAGASPGVGGGRPGGSGSDGGGISNAGNLSLLRVGVVGNAAGAGGSGGWGSRGLSGGGGGNGGDGGGIYNAGTLKVTGSAIHNNNAGTGGQGGGVGSCDCGGYGGGGGGGGVGGSGGGIYNAAAANLTVTGSTIDANQAGSGGGGGPNGFLPPPAASGGHGGDGGGGGGISAASGYLGVTNSTLAGNDAGGGGGGGRGGTYCPIYPGGCHGGAGGSGGAGGAIAASGLTTESLVRNATVADNGTVAGGPGGGGRYPGVGGASGNGGGFADSTALSLQNTIVASNNANGAANCNPSSGVANDGHDLSYGDSSCPGANGNPALQALSDYGGPTETMALAPGSAAIDQVPASGAGCPATDQRGVKRPQGSACDIGAFEFATPHITITAPANGASYMKGSTVLAAYSCSEGGITSPIATCTGTVASGKPIDTSTTGTRHFTVTTTDKAANQTTTTITYKITT